MTVGDMASYKGFESKKSLGPDGLKPITLKHLPQSMITSIKMIDKASIALHFTPTKWKSPKVVYIPKIGKDDYALAKSYRPISLMNYLLKGCRHSVRRQPPTYQTTAARHRQ